MRVLVTGATGLVGTRLVAALHGRGDEIVALVRDPGTARRKLPEATELVAADLERDPLPAPLIDSCDAIVHLAGESIGRRWTPEWKERIRSSRVESTRKLVEAIRGAGNPPRVLVSASAIGWYGDRGDEELDDRSPAGRGFLPEICTAWEQAAQAALASVRVACLRTGIVLAREGGALERMKLPFRLGVGGPLGNGRQWMSWIHVDDEIGLILLALGDERARGPIDLVSPGTTRNRDFVRSLGRALRRPAFLPAPAFALRLALGEMSALVLESQRVHPRRALELGYRFRHRDLDPALADLLS